VTNHNFKLLLIDIDGTLLNKHGNISAEDKAALVKARQSGLQVSLSTGRALNACLNIISQLSLDNYHITFDGALVSSSSLDEEVYVQPVSPEVVKQMDEFAHCHDIDLELHSATHYFAERETWSTEAHRQFFNIEPTIINFTNLWERERIIKGGLVATNPHEESKIENFCRHFADSLHFSWARTPAYPGVAFINILAPKVSKGKALEALVSHLGVSLAEVIAAGDGTNDISFLTSAGFSIAMGNAPDEVKAVADHITLDVDHSGLAAAINKFLC